MATATEAPPPTSAAYPPMTPGRYLRLRREAMGLAIEDVARMLSPAPHGQSRVVEQLRQLEADDPAALAFDLGEDLHDIFNFDLNVFDALVARAADPETEIPLPQICRRCACSWNDPCVDERMGPCAWTDRDPELCTHCESALVMTAAALGAPTPGGDHAA